MAEHEQIDFDDEFLRIWKADPFVPFEIVTTSGDRYEITDPLNLGLGTSTVFIVLPKTGVRYIRRYNIVALHVYDPVS